MKHKFKVTLLIIIVTFTALSCSLTGFMYVRTNSSSHIEASKINYSFDFGNH